MRQMIDLDNYIEMIKSVGVEAAYAMRFRRTGRSVRDILRLTLALSEGKKIVMRTSRDPGRTLDHHNNILRQVRELCTVLNMDAEYYPAYARIVYKQSGGRIQVVTNAEHFWRGRRDREQYEEYTLHDS